MAFLRMARSVSAVPWKRRMSLLRTALVMSLIEIGLRTMPLPRVAAMAGARFGGPPGKPRGRDPRKADPDSIWAATVILRHWPHATCLRESLLFAHLLREKRPILRIGVAATKPMRAHAWLEVEGEVRGFGHVDFAALHPLNPPTQSR